MEERAQAIKNAYKKLTTRDIEISFEKDPTYYVLKQGERQKWVIYFLNNVYFSNFITICYQIR